MKRKIIVLTGATASGKTKLSIALAKKLNAQIICADSRIVYKNLDIVSAKPDEKEKEGIVHHLIDILEPEKEFSAGDFVSEAKKILDNTSSDIIISGGTWFYIKSLLSEYELIECPKNTELRKELEILDTKTLWEKLNALDFKRASEVHPNNKDKIIRSIEMCEFLGYPISEYKHKINDFYTAQWFMTDIEREKLYERINLRVDKMIEQGLYEEWQKNKARYPNSKILENTIGYKEFFEYENIDFAIDKIKQHTRNFAKRQLTYFKSRPDIIRVQNIDDILENLTC
ncbi:MAG: tRNA (adenosine(37)-N6)-dimethylallyltransferase MiaA [Candidatus Gastranaerophilales bacterium]|nr:tRNA (adenosine(37)-N6)-dimethylallyltransferase MiaA [Candidatus Gastranaerophilales bacterium]